MQNRKKRERLNLTLQVLLTALLALSIGYLFMGGDRQGPEITFSNNERVLSGVMTETQLVEGISASDDVDGDVSDTLRVESATKVADNRVLLVYTAKDRSNNVSSTTRTVVTDETFRYERMIMVGSGEVGTGADASQGADVPEDSGIVPADSESVPQDKSLPADTESVESVVESTISDVESIPAESETASVVTDSSVADSSVTDSSISESVAESSVAESVAEESVAESNESGVEYEYDSEISTEDSYRQDQFVSAGKKPSSYTDEQIADLGESLRNANNMSISRLPDGYPVIRLNTYAVKKSASESFSPLRYISDIRDDADPAADIFGRISVTGNGELDKPGIHTVNYYVKDSDGNRSNVAHLVVIVTE